MRNLNTYDLIISDIDNTLVYGPWTTLMHHTWNWFHSEILTLLLMKIQATFKIYKVNMKLYYLFKCTDTPIVFLTVRKSSNSTLKMLYDIMGETPFSLIELGTDYGVDQKTEVVERYLERFPDILFIDDNKNIRFNVSGLEVDTLDPVLMRENLLCS